MVLRSSRSISTFSPPTTHLQHAEEFVVTADATKSLVLDQNVEEEKDDKFVNMKKVAEETIEETPTIEQLLDEVDKQNKAVQEILERFNTEDSDDTQENDVSKSDTILQDDHASAERLSLPDHMDHICEEVTSLYIRIGDMESSIVQQVSADFKSSLPTLITESLKEQLPQDLPHVEAHVQKNLQDQLFNLLLKPMYKEFNAFNKLESQIFVLLQKELSKSIHKDIKQSIRLKVKKGMKEVQDKLSWCTSTVATNSQHVRDLRVMIKDIVSLLEAAKVFKKDNAKGEKWEKNIVESKGEQPADVKVANKESAPLASNNKPSEGKELVGSQLCEKEEPGNELVQYQEEGGSNPKAPKLKPFITPEGPLSQEEFDSISGNYKRLKTLGFSEWLKVHALASKKLTAEDKKRKRTEFIKEVFVTGDVRVNGMDMNLIPPPGVLPIQAPPVVVPIEWLVIKEPESGIFYMNRNTDVVFQRESEFHLTPTVKLIRIQNQIKVDSEIANEMFRIMNYVIEARSDCIKARETVVMKGLSECKASESNIRRIQVKDIIKKVKDYLKTYSLAGMDISWYVEGIR
ncbi:hypothetical protein Tco_1057971 [Tanacetum coccineum]|uniref:Uncharacterized protein n=1 Tax=Tanacetum coccineum TaxID=301880 RepID=A0ABQ5H7M0_9ASTR